MMIVLSIREIGVKLMANELHSEINSQRILRRQKIGTFWLLEAAWQTKET